MDRRPLFSLIVPTRGRPTKLARLLDSLATTAAHPDRIEVLLVVDSDDPESLGVQVAGLNVRHVVGPPGRTMGELNNAGYCVSSGDRIMLLNDDVIVRTRAWDATILGVLREFPDPFVLVHVNDTLIREHLCVFPLVSRDYCELAGGVCPAEYQRYRIDDHIEDVFNILATVGERRTVYLPDVVFEHTNAVEHPTAGRVYESDPVILAADAPKFDALFGERKKLAMRILEVLGSPAARQGDLVASLADPFALRTPGRQRVVRSGWRRAADGFTAATGLLTQAIGCARRKGLTGLAGAIRRRLSEAVQQIRA